MNLLTIVDRFQFNSLFRHGYIYLPKAWTTQVIFDRKEELKENLISLLRRYPPIEYEEDILALVFRLNEQPPNHLIRFEIEQLIEIRALSSGAKDILRDKLDGRLDIEEVAGSDDLLHEVIQLTDIEERKKAVSFLWQILELKIPAESVISDLGEEDLNKGLELRGIHAKATELINFPFWSIVLAYDRYSGYPEGTISYFFDLGEIFAYATGNDEFPEESKYFKLLQSLAKNKRLTSLKISEIIQESKEAENFLIGLQDKSGSVDALKVVPLFLYLKEEIRIARKTEDIGLLVNPGKYKKVYGKELPYAVLLLGYFFGYRTLYDYFYDLIPLGFLKRKTKKAVKKDVEVEQPHERKEVKGTMSPEFPFDYGEMNRLEDLDKLLSAYQGSVKASDKEVKNIFKRHLNLKKDPKIEVIEDCIEREYPSKYQIIKEGRIKYICACGA